MSRMPSSQHKSVSRHEHDQFAFRAEAQLGRAVIHGHKSPFAAIATFFAGSAAPSRAIGSEPAASTALADPATPSARCQVAVRHDGQVAPFGIFPLPSLRPTIVSPPNRAWHPRGTRLITNAERQQPVRAAGVSW
jgi:hypothetical protein